MNKEAEDFFNALANLEQLGIINIVQDGDMDFLIELSDEAKIALDGLWKGDIE